VTELEMPAYLAEAAGPDGPPELRRWVARLPQIVAELCDLWSLRPGAPYQPGGHCSWVAPAWRDGEDRNGEGLVLKVGWAHSEARHEADALRLWGGGGAVILHAVAEPDQTVAMLLERCVPGTPLRELAAEPDQDEIVAGVLRQIWRPPPAGHRYRPLREMCDAWADELDLDQLPAGLDRGLARAGAELFRQLPARRGWPSTPSRTSVTLPTTCCSTC
jgi:streptomycin 6-kinase